VDPTGAMFVEYAGENEAGLAEVQAIIEGDAQLQAFATEQAANIPEGILQAAIKGGEGEDAVIGAFQRAGWQLDEQISFGEQASGGIRTRLDILLKRPNASGGWDRFFVEVKNGASARLTPNQTSLFPTLTDGAGLFARGTKAVDAGLTLGRQYIIPGVVVWI
jgi:hypothetical protein